MSTKISSITATFTVGKGSISFVKKKFYIYCSGQISNSKLCKGHEHMSQDKVPVTVKMFYSTSREIQIKATSTDRFFPIVRMRTQRRK